MVDFKKDTWIYVLIAAVLAIISLFVPVGSEDLGGGVTAQYWWSGILSYYSGGGTDMWMGGQAATLWTFGLTAFCAALLLFYGIHNMKGMEFKWDWLVYLLVGIVLIIFPILMWVYDGDPDVMTGFAPIGVLLAGIVAIIAFLFEKVLFRGGAPAA
jgi:peptidoglycan/LPS O-acetylase OafA/YrhL